MTSRADRAALPAVVLTGLFAVLLNLAINPDPSHVVYPVPIEAMVGIAAAYIIIALMCTYPSLGRSAGVLAAMIAVHLLTALLAGLGYSALPGSGFSSIDGLLYSLTSYLPGFMLHAAIGLLAAPVAAATFGGVEDEARRLRVGQLRSLRGVESPDDALDRLCEDPAISGVALCAGHLSWGGGIWRRDPEAACHRIRLILRRSGNNSQTMELGDANLAIEARQGHVVAVAINDPELGYVGKAAARSVHQFAARRLMPVRPGHAISESTDE